MRSVGFVEVSLTCGWFAHLRRTIQGFAAGSRNRATVVTLTLQHPGLPRARSIRCIQDETRCISA